MQLPSWLQPFSEAYESYLEMRKRKKYVLTARAERQLLNKLYAYQQQGFDIEAMLDEANEKNWKSVFPNERTPKVTRDQYGEYEITAEGTRRYRRFQ